MYLLIRYTFFIVLVVGTFSFAQAQSDLNIIPLPGLIKEREGKFKVKETFSWYAATDSMGEAVSLFMEQLAKTSGAHIRRVGDPLNADLIMIGNTQLKKDAYTLDITLEKIRIRASNTNGVFYASQTLMQMFPPEIFGSVKALSLPLELNCVWIEDAPLFTYRGMHLDVCRHFFPKEFIKKYIDYIAMHKMNYFHWHLTDDQGWRIEIKKYPKLTSIGSKRKETLIGSYAVLPHKYDNTPYEGFYTHDEIREVVAYAAKRYVTVIPEIEMPGHALAALSAYPEYSCMGGPLEAATTWGVFEDVFCPKEATFNFLEGVLSEVIDLFPSPYIHIGGDESPKDRWKVCAHCQQLIKDQGLKNEEELQSYFIHRIEKFINSKSRKIIGWDEILEGGLAPNATVMSWRGTKGGIEAAHQSHDVIMTPGSHCYFDHYQSMSLNEPVAIGGYTPVMKVYNFEPIPAELNDTQKHYILGAQGNVWTEYILNPAHVEYMAMPRMCALAEVDWTINKVKDEAGFRKRLIAHLLRLKAMNCNFATHILDPEINTATDKNGNLLITLIPASATDKIRYSIGKALNDGSEIYKQPVVMNSSGQFYYQSQSEIPGSLLSINFQKSLSFGKDISLKDMPSERYPGSKGANTLTDGLRGGKRFNGQNWIGFSGQDLDASIDLGSVQTIKEVAVGSLENKGAWVKAPKQITIFVSDNGTDWEKKYSQKASLDADNLVKVQVGSLNSRYLRILLENGGLNDPGDPGAGKASWLFVDEILLN